MEGNLSALNITKEQLEAKIEQAAKLQAELDKNKPLADELKSLNDEIHYGMQVLGSRRTDPIAGFYGLRSITKSVRLIDEGAVVAWLEKNVMAPEVYYTDPIPAKLDVKGLTKLAEDTLDQTGEIIPGLEQVESESFTLKRASK